MTEYPRRSSTVIVPGFACSGPGRCAAANPDDPSFHPRSEQDVQDHTSWGAPRIHGELLKLGINVGESSVSKYMVRSRKPPAQTWRTFLEIHAGQLVSLDFFTVPTIRFQVLYVFLVLAHDRRRILHFHVTAHPTAEWTGQQLHEALPFDQLLRYLLRDRDAIFGNDFENRCETWASAKFCRHRAHLGREPMSNG
jgi:hypothetical protein